MNVINTREHLERELGELRRKMLRLGSMAGEAVERAVWAMKNQDEEVARSVRESDDAIDDLAEEIDRECLNFIARFQPLAQDLRTVASIMHMAIDAERIGDHGGNLAKMALELSGKRLIKPLIDIPRMREIFSEMLERSLTALERNDVDLACSVFSMDDRLDDLEKQILRELLILMMENPKRIEQATLMLNAARTLERAGDHVTNLAEYVVYIATGRSVRASDYRRPLEDDR